MENEIRCSNQQWLDGAYNKLLVKMKAECERIGTDIPYTTGEDGKYHDVGTTPGMGIDYWTNGFWPGMLWQMYEAKKYHETAVGVEDRLNEALVRFETLHHDVGFMYLLSSVANYRKTGDQEARRRGLAAASALASRYNLDGRFIRAWNDDMVSVAKLLGGQASRRW